MAVEEQYNKVVEEKNIEEQKKALKILIATSLKAKRFRVANYMLALEEGEYEKAQSQLLALRGLCPNTDLYYLKAKMLYTQGSMDAAFSLLQQVLQSDPDHKDSQKLRKIIKRLNGLKEEANAVFKEGNYEEAVKKYTECLEQSDICKGFKAVIYTNRATALIKQEKYEEALKDLDKAIECNDKYPQAFHKRGDVNIKLKNFDDAIRDMQCAQELDPVKFDLTEKIQQTRIDAKHAKRKDYYAILGVTKESTEDEIKKAYRKLALKWHPDRAHTPEEKEKAEKMFKDIAEAYSVLTDKEKKRRYDMGQDPEGQDIGFGGGINPFDLFSAFFSSGAGNDDGMPSFSFGRSGGSSNGNFGAFPGFMNFGRGGGGRDRKSVV